MDLAKQLAEQRRLTEDEYASYPIPVQLNLPCILLSARIRYEKIYKNHVYIRGLIRNQQYLPVAVTTASTRAGRIRRAKDTG